MEPIVGPMEEESSATNNNNINWSIVYWFIILPFLTAIAYLFIVKVIRFIIDTYLWVILIGVAIAFMFGYIIPKRNRKSVFGRSTGNESSHYGWFGHEINHYRTVMACALHKYYIHIGIAGAVIIVVAVIVVVMIRAIAKRRHQRNH